MVRDKVADQRVVAFSQARTAFLVMFVLNIVTMVLEQLGVGDQTPSYIFTIGLVPLVSGAYLASAVVYLALPIRDIELIGTVLLAVLFEFYLFLQRPYTWDMATRFSSVGVGVGAAAWLAILYRALTTTGEQREQAKGYLWVASIMPLFPKISSWFHYFVVHHTTLLYDQYGFAVDGLLGFQPAMEVARFLTAIPPLRDLCMFVYNKLPVWMVLANLLWLHRPARQYFNPLAVMVVAAFAGLSVYKVLPMVGLPMFFHEYPPPPLTHPVPVPIGDPLPVSCMPSLHATWIFLVFLSMAPQSRRWAGFGAVLVLLTLLCTLSREVGHYFIDLVMALPFTLVFVALGTNPYPENRRLRAVCVALGSLSFGLGIYLIRFQIQALLAHPALSVLYFLLVALLSVYAHYRLARVTLAAQARRCE